MQHLTILNVNMQEAQLLAKSKSRDVKTLAKKIRNEGMYLIITDGPRGSYLVSDEGTVFARPRTIPVVSRTGAGDAFGSGTVAALIKGHSIEDALKIGTINAEGVIQSYGAKQGILKKWPSTTEMKQIKVRQI